MYSVVLGSDARYSLVAVPPLLHSELVFHSTHTIVGVCLSVGVHGRSVCSVVFVAAHASVVVAVIVAVVASRAGVHVSTMAVVVSTVAVVVVVANWGVSVVLVVSTIDVVVVWTTTVVFVVSVVHHGADSSFVATVVATVKTGVVSVSITIVVGVTSGTGFVSTIHHKVAVGAGGNVIRASIQPIAVLGSGHHAASVSAVVGVVSTATAVVFVVTPVFVSAGVVVVAAAHHATIHVAFVAISSH
mmetsp:Transcript_37652/g.91454  ORF Transcript_37652/g.91454 Transcript_37652/m.91454 type:complete len:244 (+) Transcript_37652:184-915(+)